MDLRRTPLRLMAAAAAGVILLGGSIGVAQAAASDRSLAAVLAGPALAAPVTTMIDTPEGEATVSVNPVSALPASGAQITVRGEGFNPDDELWIAVCQDDGVAPAALVHCLGGPIPDFNSSPGWAVITAGDSVPYAGPVVAPWRKNGSFKVTLQVLSAAGADADCLGGDCAVYLRSADDSDRTLDAQIPVRFVAPATGTAAPTTSVELSTETVGGTPTTVAPDSLALDSIPAGQEQTVTFSGFTPREKIDVTLYSDPIELPVAQADGSGIATIVFEIPEDLELGSHLIQAVGRKSGVVGIAPFTVTEAEVSETAEETTATTATTEPTATTDETTEDDSTAEIGETVTDDAAPSTTEAPAETTASDDIAAEGEDTEQEDGSGGLSRSAWLLIALVAIVVIGGTAGIIAMVRRRGAEQELPQVRAYPTTDQPTPHGAPPPTAFQQLIEQHGADQYAAPQPAAPTWQDLTWQNQPPTAPPTAGWQDATPPAQEPAQPAPDPDHWTGLFGDSGARPDPERPEGGRHHRSE